MKISPKDLYGLEHYSIYFQTTKEQKLHTNLQRENLELLPRL